MKTSLTIQELKFNDLIDDAIRNIHIGSIVTICEPFTENRLSKINWTVTHIYSGCYQIISDKGAVRYIAGDCLMNV